MKKVAINASGGGSDTGATGNGIVEKDISLKISNIINQRLNDAGIETLLLRSDDKTISYDDRVNKLNGTFDDPYEVVLLSNTLNAGGGSGIEIIYPLSKNNKLASMIGNNLEYFNDTRYFQYRWPTDTSKDYYYLTRITPNYETIIVRYGYVDNQGDANIIKSDYVDMANSVADALIEYINGANTYQVKSGDTLYSIARKFGVSVKELKEYNDLVNDSLVIGLVLKIPEVKKKEEVKVNEKYQYVVKSGDTLYGIAKKYNTSVDKLKSINNKKNNTLSIGEVLNLYSTITIKSGDTLYSIAKKYNTSVDKIKELNDLKNNTLTIGNILYIP